MRDCSLKSPLAHWSFVLILGKNWIGGGKGVNWGGNEGVPKMVLARLYFLVIAMIKKDEKLSQKLSRLFLLS